MSLGTSSSDPHVGVRALIRGLSRDARIEWLAWTQAGLALTARAGRIVPERAQRALIRPRASAWSDRLGRARLRVAWKPERAGSAAELEAWGAALLQLGSRTGRRQPAEPVELVLHDLAQLLLHAELELGAPGEAGPAAPERARAALSAARTLLAGAPRAGASTAAYDEPADDADLRTLLEREARQALSASGRTGTVELHVRAEARPIPAASALPLARLARNLIVNALQASPRAGRVWVETRGQPSTIELCVRDEGRGLPSEAARALFERGADRPRGRGLGARSVRACVQSLGGEIEVQSAPGRGTEVRVRLPAAPAAPALLLVDPDPTRRARRARSLQPSGAHVIAVGSPAEGLEASSARALAAVVLARGAPLDGLGELLQRAREGRIAARVLGWRAERDLAAAKHALHARGSAWRRL